MEVEDHSGRMLGEFLLRERMAVGGFGTVYRCDQPLLGREAVVKVLHQRLPGRRVALQRFLREAQLATLLDHPYAAHVYAFGIEDDGLLWIAMELVHGVTLDRWLETRGPMPLDQLVPFFERVAEVVQAAHEKGIVHRDLKPSNVMIIERAGQLLPKLLDFGVAKVLDEIPMPDVRDTDHARVSITSRGDDDPTDPEKTASLRARGATRPGPGRTRLTTGSAAIGSPPYMAPEQWTNPLGVGAASDLYALGVIAYESLTGRRPFVADTVDEYRALHRDAPVPPLAGSFSPPLNDVFQRALAKRPEDRWGSALDLAAALRASKRAHLREQVRVSAQQWRDRSHSAGLLWRGDALADLDQWTQRTPDGVLTELEYSFIAASRRHARRVVWIRRALLALVASGLLAGIQYRAYLQSRMAQEFAERSVTQAAVEQGRQALLHGESAEAQLHLAEAYRRGDRSRGVEFMLARSLQPRIAEQARFAAASGRVWSAAFSPDGRQIVTTDDEAAQIWDATSHQRLFTLRHGDTVYQAVFSPDGSRLITVGGDSTIRVWNTATGDPLRVLKSRDATLRYSTVATSTRFVAVIDMMGKAAHVWDSETGTQIAELDNDGSEFPSLAFSADGRWLATSGGNDVRVFDTATWTRVTTIGTRVHTLAFDPTRPRLLTGSADGDASIWELPGGARVHHLREVGEPVDVVAFSPDGRLVVTASRDGAQQVWDASGTLVSQANHFRDKIYSVEFDRTSKLVLAAGANGTVVVADAALGMPLATFHGPSGIVRVAHFDPTSQRVIGASMDGTARVWDAAPQYHRWSSTVGEKCMDPTSLEPDGRFIAASCSRTRVWDTARNQMVAELPPVTPALDGFEGVFPAVSAAGDRAAIARGSSVEIYAVPGGELLRTIVHAAAVNAVAFAPTGHDVVTGGIDGSLLLTRNDRDPIALPSSQAGIDVAAILGDGRVVAADSKRRLRIYDPDHRLLLADLETTARLRMLRPSPDERLLVGLAILTRAVPPAVWDLVRYTRIAQLEGHLGLVYSARFVSNGILTAGGDGTVRLWHAITGELRRTYRAKSRFLVDATLSPDGAAVVAGGADGVLRFWDATNGRPLWTMTAHRSVIVGIHVEGKDIVTRSLAGDLTRWSLPDAGAVIKACVGLKECGIVLQ